jgi:hypothetical protein
VPGDSRIYATFIAPENIGGRVLKEPAAPMMSRSRPPERAIYGARHLLWQLAGISAVKSGPYQAPAQLLPVPTPITRLFLSCRTA